MAWEREDISLDEAPASGTPYVLILQGPQLAEIDAALRHFQYLAQPMDTLDPSTFPLPCLHSVLRSVSHNLHSGYGFTLIRGVPVERYTRAENIIIYVGISSHIAAIRGRQDHQFKGQPADVMLAHITDMRRPGDVQNYALAAYSDSEVVFHTDVGDIVSLFVLGEPPSCGSSPERVILQFSRRSFSGFGAHSQPSMLSPTQVEALDALHFLAEKHHVAMELKTGDMQFINNLSMIHARNSYVDDPENRHVQTAPATPVAS
ncbi:hypothetical protein APSETT444_002959 [Aspergillus pseudonomiae]